MKKYKTAAILAGGKSTRMGKDKKNLVISGEALLQSIVDQLAVLFDEIIIVGCKKDEINKIHGITGVYPDALDVSASLTGIYTALLYSQSSCVYVTACDMPNYDLAFIRHMMALLEENPEKKGCVTRYKEWIEPFNAFYSRDLLPSAEEFLKSGRKSVFHYLSRENIYYIAEKEARIYTPDWSLFCNLNTPGDLTKHLKGVSDVSEIGRNCKDHSRRRQKGF
ncbi:molybdenum cofactor guanylyltransferase [Eubacterium sp. 1001713B170207_170306_E7]|uniref:molybdenum cofactor guanylyltransferase n=1 Tax=Eubacterium sp. 1001713B170207_170306_E7 TaxID=2787097 RepID=UPI001899D8E2|nr:molybdenum cofactor guanylyltransferase [Eubacterium sp. 1001713B170207_170306_E7]